MDTSSLILAGLAGALATAAAPRGPDSHNIRHIRGDILVVDGNLEQDRVTPYAAPYPGWRYRALRRGERLHSRFYAARYVIADPARHRLPAAAGSRRWIRYGNDAVLVDLRGGRVLRVLAGRFD